MPWWAEPDTYDYAEDWAAAEEARRHQAEEAAYYGEQQWLDRAQRFDHERQRRPNHHDGARRRKAFARARKTLKAAARIARSSYHVTVAMNRRGIPASLEVWLPHDQTLFWSPRTGYKFIPLDPIPF